MEGPFVLDSDILSELSRGNAKVVDRVRAYLKQHGRLTFTAVTVFERLRGYRVALAAGKPFGDHLRSFQALVDCSLVLPLDAAAADCAAAIWSELPARRRAALGDILIAAIAGVRGLPLVTRNRRDFGPIEKTEAAGLRLIDWS